ncbi:MAG TPA: endoglucanase [Caulobacteraceae bacterium]|jgi:tetratricopeptide (TPR) repeat protein|nr:endoglucanase [Caulobacteraceae bacterium]
MRPLRSILAAATALSLVFGPLAPAAAGPGGVEILVGSAKGLSRLEFKGSQPVSARREGGDIVLRFGAVAAPDLARLHTDPPKYLKTAVAAEVKGGLELRLTLDGDPEAHVGKADGVTYVALGPPPAPIPAAPAPKDQTPEARANPVPQGGVVRMRAELQGGALKLHFPWRAPLGAAVFRRGDAVWLVFDAPAKLDLSEAPHGLTQMRTMQAVAGDRFSAVRIVAPVTTVATATVEAGTWTLTLGPSAAAAPIPITLGREDAAGPATLTAQVAGSTGVFWIADPVVGDRIAAVTALGPAKGLPGQRTFVDATLFPSSQGLAVQPIADDLQVAADGDIVRIGRPRGLALSPASMQARNVAASPLNLPHATALPALVDFTGWSRTGAGGFNARYAQLQDAAAQEAAKGRGGGVQARLGLARFLIGTELAPEALGVLGMIAKAEPTMMSDPEFRGLRGAARVLAGRLKEAQADFSSPVLAEDPASALWRGYVAARLGDYAGAREQLTAGRSALAQFAPKWKARFARADVDAALALNDLGAAKAALLTAQGEALDPTEAAGVRLAEAKLADAAGQADRALGLYDEVATSNYGALAAPAILRATEIRLNKGRIDAPKAVAILDSLRFRWRGDATELETIRSLGRIYVAQGRYREALEALRSAGQRLPDLPAAAALQADLSTAFKALFLTGGADGMQPVQALALFYDFKEFTPIGAEGDLMVRKLARRLVDVDLLDQAAELLKYQAENRLDGVPRAEVSTDLAMIQLMNRKPEQALLALNSSRTTLLPAALNADRRMLEARAWLQLGQFDHATEILGKDASSEAQEVRAEIAWKQHSWTDAGKTLEIRLGDRWKQDAPLTPDEETKLLRAGAAYSLAGDEQALTRLRTRYAKFGDGARAPEAMKVALSGGAAGALTASDFSRAVSDVDSFAGWVERMKKKFRSRPAPVSTGAPSAKLPSQTAAAGAPPPKALPEKG